MTRQSKCYSLGIFFKTRRRTIFNLFRNHSDKTSETETKQKTVPSAEQQNDDSLCSTELPRPMDIFLEDDLLGISY